MWSIPASAHFKSLWEFIITITSDNLIHNAFILVLVVFNGFFNLSLLLFGELWFSELESLGFQRFIDELLQYGNNLLTGALFWRFVRKCGLGILPILISGLGSRSQYPFSWVQTLWKDKYFSKIWKYTDVRCYRHRIIVVSIITGRGIVEFK